MSGMQARTGTPAGPVQARSSRLLLGAFVGAVVVNVLQLGSVEVAAGMIGRTLLHSTSAAQGCTATTEVVDYGPTTAAWALYRRSFGEAAGTAGSPQRRQGSVVELVRDGPAKTIEALGGRLPPERALQSVALAVVVRSSGTAASVGFAPPPQRPEICP
jgi:hypothetical protein